MYVLFVAYKTKTPFNVDLIKSIDNTKSFDVLDYFLGLVSVLISLNIIETRSDSISELKIDNMSPYLCSKIKDEVLSYYDKPSEDEPEAHKKRKGETPEEFIERINKLFGYTE